MNGVPGSPCFSLVCLVSDCTGRGPPSAAPSPLSLLQRCSSSSSARCCPRDRRRPFIFGGDGGSLVLGSLLMTTFYARPDSPLCENSLRWGFLGIGAVAFMDAFCSWTGKEEDIPFGVQEGALSDPSALVETYGWTIQLMI